MARILIIFGVTIVLTGLLWPWLEKMGLGRLPGDMLFNRGNTRFYFPITTCIVISLAVSLLLWLLKK